MITVENSVDKRTLLISIKIDADTYRLCKTASSWLGVSLTEYISDAVRPKALRDCAKISKESAKPEKPESD